MFRILHLSDIHIGKTYKEPESIACKIASDIDHTGLNNIDCIVVTGDIFDGQAGVSKELVDLAVDFFVRLLDEINCNQGNKMLNKEDVIFVPGNHDLIRDDDTTRRWVKYNNFLMQFYGNIPSFYKEKYSLFKKYTDQKIAFIGFNSCQIEKKKMFDAKYLDKLHKHADKETLTKYGIDKGKLIEVLNNEVANEYDDYGYIPLSQITPIERYLKGLDDYTVVALFHHHFYLFPEIAQQFGDSSLVRNYAEVVQHLKYMNVSIVLHGHKHFALERPFIMEDYYESRDNIIDVFAGGSVGTDRKEEHTFSVLDLYENKADIKLRHHKFIYNGENLEPIVTKQIPPKKLTGRIIKLLEIIKNQNPEKYELYESTSEKSFKSYDSCNKIIGWISEAITGFTEVYRYLDSDWKNIMFLLYAVHFRTISYMKIVGKEHSYYETAYKTWMTFYEENLEQMDFAISKEDYHKLFGYKKLKGMTTYCDQLLNTCNNKKSQIYLAFTMLGIFFTDLYLVLTKYADDFKESIKSKINIKIEENKFHENVPAPRIVVSSDADRRSTYIELLCNEATAHKMAVLFVKEFDLLINKFEDYFKLIGLKLYYLHPRIDRDRMKNTLDNYNFEAYIPTLIPLLTGDNIYSSKVVFARELIQNSIDAIAVRAAKDVSPFSNKITIDLKNEQNGKRYFMITDHGTGMDRYKIERYFTSIGRSFYSIGGEYDDLNIDYKPISSFGIGFLSSFMVCKEIDVKTKYYLENSEGLKLHIPNYDGCFFIELDEDVTVGTQIKLYLNTEIENEDIICYLERVMQDIKYDIDISYLNRKGLNSNCSIKAHHIRKQVEKNEFKFFVPFLETGKAGNISYINDILTNEYMDKYEYGLLIRPKQKKENECVILNAGIAVEQATMEGVFGKLFEEKSILFHLSERNDYTDIIVNFPSNWIQLDVARENITGFSDELNKMYQHMENYPINVQIAENLYGQIREYIEYTAKRKTNVSAICLEDVIRYALKFCVCKDSENVRTKLNDLRYKLKVEFTQTGVSYKISRDGDKKIAVLDSSRKARFARKKCLEKIRESEPVLKSKFGIFGERKDGEMLLEKHLIRFFGEVVQEDGVRINSTTRYELSYALRSMQSGLEIDRSDKSIFKIITFGFLNSLDGKIKIEEVITEYNLLENLFLKYFFIGAENEQNIFITYEELITYFQKI